MLESLEIHNTDHSVLFKCLISHFTGRQISGDLAGKWSRWLERNENGFDRLLSLVTATTAGNPFSRLLFVPLELLFGKAVFDRRFWDNIHCKTMIGEKNAGVAIIDRAKKDILSLVNRPEHNRIDEVVSCPFVYITQLAKAQKAKELETIFKRVKELPVDDSISELMRWLLLWWSCKKYQDELLGSRLSYP